MKPSLSPKKEKPPTTTEDGTSSTVVVRNLPSTTTSAEFSTFCSSLAPIQHAFVVTNKTDSGELQCEGYGFVTFHTKEDATSIVSKSPIPYSNPSTQLVTLAYAKPRNRSQPKEKHVQLSKDPSLPALRPRLIFRNLAWKVRHPEQLQKIVSKYGKAKEIKIPKGKNGRMTGFAFVEMTTRKAAGKVVEGVNGMEIEGRPVAVDWCINKDEWAKEVKETTTAREAPLEGNDDEEEDQSVKDEEEKEDDDLPDEDEEMEDDEEPIEVKEGDEDDQEEDLSEPTSRTIFIRNIPYLVTRKILFDLFRPLGHIGSLYVVTDPETGLSRGTAFINFSTDSSSQTLLDLDTRIKSNTATPQEIQQYTLEGRTLEFLPAVNRDQATRLKEEHATKKREDKRNLYLLKEGQIDETHPFFASLSAMDVNLREDSMRQRKELLASNPSLYLSFTRLALRNIPRTMKDGELRDLARKAIKEFDEEVKNGLREGLTEEELAKDRPFGKPVRQAKIVLEKNGRSKGYGFLEYNGHANALKGLRWLNGRVVGERTVDGEGDRKRRLLVEFAIENAQVVKRRQDKEDASKRRVLAAKEAEKEKRKGVREKVETTEKTNSLKRKRDTSKRGDADKTKKGNKRRMMIARKTGKK
jgi:nucleolar protein 4